VIGRGAVTTREVQEFVIGVNARAGQVFAVEIGVELGGVPWPPRQRDASKSWMNAIAG
jgi:hypothetical protein